MKYAVVIATSVLLTYLLGAFIAWSWSWPADTSPHNRLGAVLIFAIMPWAYGLTQSFSDYNK